MRVPRAARDFELGVNAGHPLAGGKGAAHGRDLRRRQARLGLSDSAVYDREASERHYQTLIALFEATLKNASPKD